MPVLRQGGVLHLQEGEIVTIVAWVMIGVICIAYFVEGWGGN